MDEKYNSECAYCQKLRTMKYRIDNIDGCYIDFCTIKCVLAYIKKNWEEIILRL